MTAVSLRDRLGAMAIVDALYQQQVELEEHLNLSDLHQRVAQGIRDYYQQQGKNVSDELIEEGVRAWFASRLRFELPTILWHQRWLAGIYLFVRSHSTKLVVGLALILALVVFGIIGNASMAERQARQIVAMHQEIAGLQARYQELEGRPVHYIAPLIEPLKTQYQELIKKTDPDVLKVSGEQQQMMLSRRGIEDNIQKATKTLDEWQALADDDQYLATLFASPSFHEAYKDFPLFQSAFDRAVVSLTQEGKMDGQTLDQMTQQVNWATPLRSKVQQQLQSIQALKLPKNEMAPVLSVAKAADQALLKLDQPEKAQQLVDEMAYFQQLIDAELSLRVVNRDGFKTAVERNFTPSGGKAWYQIVEAITPAGKVFPIWVTDSETGERKRMEMFGVRISQQHFEKLRKDKMDDGHISPQLRLVAEKPSGRLGFRHNRPVQDGIITEW